MRFGRTGHSTLYGYRIPTRGQVIHRILSYTHDTVIHTWYCHTHMILSYTHDTVIHTWYCHTHMILSYTHDTVIHTWYCHTHMILSYTHDTVIHTWYCHTHMILSYTHDTVIHTWYCHTHMVDMVDCMLSIHYTQMWFTPIFTRFRSKCPPPPPPPQFGMNIVHKGVGIYSEFYSITKCGASNVPIMCIE